MANAAVYPSTPKPEVILYDLACITPNTGVSPVVWMIRLLLNYKRIPYRTVFLEFPDIAEKLEEVVIPLPATAKKYTVPAIHHLPTSTLLMDSEPIAAFLSTQYPTPLLPLSSPLGDRVKDHVRGSLGRLFRTLLVPREYHVLSPRSQEYFARTREAYLGHPLSDLEQPGVEEKAWESAEPGLVELERLWVSGDHAGGEGSEEKVKDGPFVLGGEPSLTDFWLVGILESMLVVYPGGWKRLVSEYQALGRLWEACKEWREWKRD